VLAPDSVNVGLLAEWVRRSNGTIKLVTFAPELDGANAIVREASTSGFTLAMGHSNATMSEAVHAIVRGVRYAVHTFNAMRGFTHREPGIVGAILSDDRVYTEVIADGVHVAPTTVRILARCKGPDRVLLVTDATAAAGMPDGTYTLGDQRVRVIKGVCRNAQGQLAGSALRLDVGLRNFMMWTGASLEHAVRSVTVNPARALGLKGHGVIEPGARADLAILDDHDTVVATFVGGRQVFAREV
jgi:N-acetylglucosamine-6-phosphate deacetylase